jgi:hypothetical protein
MSFQIRAASPREKWKFTCLTNIPNFVVITSYIITTISYLPQPGITDVQRRFYRAISPYSNPHNIFPFPGLEMRKLDLSTHNAPLHPSRWTALHFYRPIGCISADLPNLHVCAHLYASDRNSLFLVSNAVGFGDEVGNMGSLSHSVVLHVRSEELLLQEGEWYIQEAWTPRSGEGRGVHESRIWNSKGVNIASSWQEGMVRKAEREEEQRQRLLWEEEMKRVGILFGEDARRESVSVSETKAKAKHKL